MAAEVDAVLLEVINTKHKKNAGTLRLLTSKLIWIPQGHSEPKISTLYSEIKGNIQSKYTGYSMSDVACRRICIFLNTEYPATIVLDLTAHFFLKNYECAGKNYRQLRGILLLSFFF